MIQKIKQQASSVANSFVLENDSVVFDGIAFHGTTLWTDFALLGDPRIAGFSCQQVMNDYKKIRREPSYAKMRSIDIAAIHQHSIAWLGQSLARSNQQKNVVVSHHAPSIQSISEYYRDDIASSAYASNLEPFINEYSPNCWLHGHVHTTSDYRISDCRVLCNPRGFKNEFNHEFNPDFLFELRKH